MAYASLWRLGGSAASAPSAQPPLEHAGPRVRSVRRWEDIAEEVKDECSKYGQVRHIFVDRNSQGFIYVKFADANGAVGAKNVRVAPGTSPEQPAPLGLRFLLSVSVHLLLASKTDLQRWLDCRLRFGADETAPRAVSPSRRRSTGGGSRSG